MFEITDPRFSNRADAHIILSNEQCREASVDKVSLSMIDASCRFNVWLWAVTSKDVAEFQSKRAQALEVLLSETAQRFGRHFEDYTKNFDEYITAQLKAAEQPR